MTSHIREDGYLQYENSDAIFGLEFYSKLGRINEVNRILEAYKKNKLNEGALKSQFKYAISSAIREGHLDVLKALIDADAPLHETFTPVIDLAISYENKKEDKQSNTDMKMVKAVVEAGVDIDQRLDDNSTPLMLAALHDKPDIMKFLFEKGAKVNIRDNDGETAMHYALDTKNPEVRSHFEKFMIRAMEEKYEPIEEDPEEMKKFYTSHKKAVKEVESKRQGIPQDVISGYVGGKHKSTKKSSNKPRKSAKKSRKSAKKPTKSSKKNTRKYKRTKK